MNLDLASDILGYLGAGLIVLLYFLTQSGRLRPEDWRSPALNLLGSLAVLVSLLFHFNAPSLVIEVFWCSISVYGLRRCFRLRQASLPFQS